MAALFDRVKVAASAAPGSGAFPIGAAVPGYRTLADAGATAQSVVSYTIEDGTAWELGHGIVSADGLHVNRSAVIASSNGGAAIAASSAAVLFLTVLAADIETVVFGTPAAFSGQSVTIKNIVSGSGFVGIAEVTFKDATGATITPVSAESSTNPFGAGQGGPAFAIDGNADTSVEVFSGAGNYLKFDFGRTVTLGSYTVQNPNSNSPNTYSPVSWDLTITNLGSEQYINSISGNPITAGTVETFTVPLNPTPPEESTTGTAYSGRFFRLSGIASNGAGYVSIAELTFYDGNGTVIPHSNVNAGSAPFGGSEVAASGADSNAATQWTGNNNSWLEIDFGSDVSPAAYSVQNRADTNVTYNAASWTLEYGDSEAALGTINAVTNSDPNTAGKTTYYIIPRNTTGATIPLVTSASWRMRMISSNSPSYLSAYDIQFRTVAGQSAHMSAVGGTGTTTNTRAGFNANDWNDSDNTTRWALDDIANIATTVFEWTFTKAVSVVEVAYLRASGSSETPNSFAIEALASDGVTWQTIKTISNYTDAEYHQDGATYDTWAVQTAPTVATSTEGALYGRYWRIRSLYSNSNYVGTGEMQWFDSSGAKIAISALTSDGNNTDPLANADDGNLATYWTSGSPGRAFLSCDLGGQVAPASFLISSRNGNTACNIIELQLDYSVDGLRWDHVAMFTPTWTGADNETRTLDIVENANATTGFATGTGPA